MVDYAYVPTKKGDGFMLHAKEFLARRDPVPLFGRRGLGNLQAILKWVDDKAQAQRPAAVLLVSHAWPHAMSIPFTPKQKGDSTYSRLADLQPPQGAFTTPARFKQAPATGQPRTRIIIKGCQIGRSEPYMRLLKTLLGGEVEVRAAQHYEYFIKIGPIQLDFLAYGFQVRRRSPIATHQSLSKAFKDAAFTRYDGTAVPPAELEALLDQLLGPAYGGAKKLKPDDYLPGPKTTANDSLENRIVAELKLPAQSDLDFEKSLGTKLVHKQNFRFESERVEYVVEEVSGTSTLPSAAQIKTRVEKLKKDWENKYGTLSVSGGGTVSKTYGEYLGLSPGEDLFTSIHWEARKTSSGFDVVAIYYRYELEMPVTSTADGILLFTGRKRVNATQVKEQLNWPGGAQFAALFRTV